MKNDSEKIVDQVIAQFVELRHEQGLSQEKLAKMAGIDRSYLSLLESGQRRPTLDVALRLAHSLGCRLTDLLKSLEGKK